DDEVPEAIFHRDIPLSRDRAEDLDGNGYLILRHRHLLLGMAYYRPHRDGEPAEPAGLVKSMLPRSWTRRLGIEPPPRHPPPWTETPGSASDQG
ncbi:MAG: hypothetical protein MI919_16080, partial [Holophagales bacterium]|nr:hypothetical protein [Holophagales bacterium]